jgi:hypothetical protein
MKGVSIGVLRRGLLLQSTADFDIKGMEARYRYCWLIWIVVLKHVWGYYTPSGNEVRGRGVYRNQRVRLLIKFSVFFSQHHYRYFANFMYADFQGWTAYQGGVLCWVTYIKQIYGPWTSTFQWKCQFSGHFLY